MQKPIIYSYLQRSLVKILIKSTHSNKYKTTLVKPLNTCCTNIAGYAKPIKKSISLPTPVTLQNKTLNFFRKVNKSFMPFLRVLGQIRLATCPEGTNQPSLNFTCKFYLISFIRPGFGVLILKCYGSILLNLAKQKKSQATKQKLIKLNQSLNNNQLSDSFRAKVLDTHFYPRTLCCNKKMVACLSEHALHSTPCIACYARRALQATLGNSKQLQAPTSLGIEKLTQRACRAKTNIALKTKALLLANSFDQNLCRACINFDFYDQHSQLFFCQSFYKRKDKSKHYRKTFHNLFYFFSFFSFTTSKEVSFFNSAELAAAKRVSLIRYAQQVLYLHKISVVTCCFQLFYFTSSSINPLNTLDFLRNKISITRACPKVSFLPKRDQMQCSSFQLLFFLTIIFYYAIKYIKQFKKQLDNPFQPMLIRNNFLDEFNQIIDFNFVSFKPFFHKLVVSGSAFNSHYFFLMRPLFSLTRLDTFFICESLKLPIYPDKSNLRVDFLRNRIRKQILPAIRILLNPQFDTILCKFYE